METHFVHGPPEILPAAADGEIAAEIVVARKTGGEAACLLGDAVDIGADLPVLAVADHHHMRPFADFQQRGRRAT
jgi:hypothetical protein